MKLICRSLYILLAAAVLTGCGSGSATSALPEGNQGDSNGGDGGFVPPPIIEEEGSQIDIQNEPLPLVEDFSANGVVDFFSPDYKPLNTPATNTIVDEDGNEVELVDPRPSFYYPTCCFYDENELGERTGELSPTIDESFIVRENKFGLLGSVRMSIGQILSDLTDDEKVERKSDTSDGVEGASVELGSWGELDLSEPYTISFCVNDAGPFGAGFSNLEIFIDNNSGGRQAESIHGPGSLLLRSEIGTFEEHKGNRLVVDVPGNARLVDEEGNQVGDTLAVNPPLDGVDMPVGTETSFIQLRVSSGGFAVMSDLVVERQGDTPVEKQTCEVDESIFEPPAPEGIPFQGLPLNVNLDLTFDQFFGLEDDLFLAFPDDRQMPFYTPRAGASRMFIANEAITWGDGRFYIGWKEGSGLEAVGGLDLSAPYRISFDVVKANPEGGNFMVMLDNTESGTGNADDGFNSVHGEATTIWSSTLDQLEPGQTITIEPDIGRENSFLQFRCDSGCGQPDGPDSELGVTITNIVIESLGDGPDATLWNGQALNLAGDAENDIEGSIDQNEPDALTITSTGGNVNSSNHQLFFAYKEINYPEFVMTARITNIAGADLPEGNGNRFGMMVLEDLIPVGNNYPDLSAWADIGFYASDMGLLGSRGQKKEDRTRTRSDIPQLEVGDWVRIEITNEEGETQKRLRRFFSKDGVEFTQANSTTDFQATTDVDNWFVGFYGAPGANEVTISFEDITVEPINPPNPWNGEALNLAGGADEDIAGSILENEADRLVINATGGDVNSSNHQLFFAYQEVALSEFRFTAQITSMEGADIPTGNGKRWGIMVLEDLEPVGNNFFDLSAWADIGFYMNEDLQALLGSRAQKKEDTTRTRSDIPGLEVGDWVRIEITNEEGETQKRLKRLISKDGVEFEQVNSTTDFQATTDVDHWFIGGYAAPGDNDLTMTLENISYEDLSGQ